VEALFVTPSAIGKGYGRALIEHAKREAIERSAKSLIIQSDPNAERFYQAIGGKLVGKRKSGSICSRYLPVFEIELT
jgi:GNAT superfamily N-acetyltransferase